MGRPLNAPGAASSPHGVVKRRTSAKKSNVAKARASSPSGVAHAEAQALAAQPLEPWQSRQTLPLRLRAARSARLHGNARWSMRASPACVASTRRQLASLHKARAVTPLEPKNS